GQCLPCDVHVCRELSRPVSERLRDVCGGELGVVAWDSSVFAVGGSTMRWLWLCVLLLPLRLAWAVNCATAVDPDGQTCTMSDGATFGTCAGTTCIRTYTIPGNGPRTGTGTISSSGATVTGSGTVFTSELHVGDVITASSTTVLVNAIA